MSTNGTHSTPPSDGTVLDRAETLTGDGLRWILDSLPGSIAEQVDYATVWRLESARFDFPLGATWSTSVCVDGLVVTYIGHEDTQTMTSVYDGSVTTSIPCGGG